MVVGFRRQPGQRIVARFALSADSADYCARRGDYPGRKPLAAVPLTNGTAVSARVDVGVRRSHCSFHGPAPPRPGSRRRGSRRLLLPTAGGGWLQETQRHTSSRFSVLPAVCPISRCLKTGAQHFLGPRRRPAAPPAAHVMLWPTHAPPSRNGRKELQVVGCSDAMRPFCSSTTPIARPSSSLPASSSVRDGSCCVGLLGLVCVSFTGLRATFAGMVVCIGSGAATAGCRRGVSSRCNMTPSRNFRHLFFWRAAEGRGDLRKLLISDYGSATPVESDGAAPDGSVALRHHRRGSLWSTASTLPAGGSCLVFGGLGIVLVYVRFLTKLVLVGGRCQRSKRGACAGS